MENKNRMLSEKNNDTDIKEIFKKNFKKQLENYVQRYQTETGKEIKESDVKKELCYKIDVQDEKSISKWLNGNCVPKIDNIIEIAKFFNCSIDELLTMNNPYEEVNQQMMKKGFSEEAIKKIEMWLRNRGTKTFVLFGDSKEVNWSPFDLINNLICNQYIDELIRDFFQISNEFFNLTKDDIEKINTIIPELKEADYCINNIQVLKNLLLELPESIKYNVQQIKDNIDSFIELHTAIYILKIYKKTIQDKIV